MQENEFRWYVLDGGAYRLQQPDELGIVSSPFFPGLRLDVQALLSGKMQQVLTLLQVGLNLDKATG